MICVNFFQSCFMCGGTPCEEGGVCCSPFSRNISGPCCCLGALMTCSSAPIEPSKPIKHDSNIFPLWGKIVIPIAIIGVLVAVGVLIYKKNLCARRSYSNLP
ncbi:hypothetical protein DPMN_138085 [Dreissena polymorpha]|uniref:Uncharacterized protein n=1 Tax=Dreissena polymorpha TaxID=45954 RepID=A0A9D4G346_DREPO|nr:hypothetical protein DPMN_138085 [Dreissena polymorpha]